MSDFLYLPDAVLADLGITSRDAVDCIERAARAEAAGQLWTAPKSAFFASDGRYMMATLAATDDPGVVAVKQVSVCPENGARGLDIINGAIMLLDSRTGLLRAVLGANWVTAVRTAGLSAVVAKRLANPDSASLALIGCGVQARSHLEAFAELFPLREVRALGRGQANIDRLCALARDRGLTARPCSDPREAVEGADLIVSSVTLTPEARPFVDARWLKPGAFASITDVARPWQPEGMAAFGTVIIDSLAQEAANTHPMVDPKLVSGDFVGLVSGQARAGFDPSRRSAFVFRGIAIGDIALAGLAWQRAVAAGKGIPVGG